MIAIAGIASSNSPNLLQGRARWNVLGELVRLAIKWLWESGELVYRNAADSLHRERREFHLTHLAHPALQLNHIDASQAVRLLLRRYLAAFGPASIDDFRWWSGLRLGPKTARHALTDRLEHMTEFLRSEPC